jgi:hypothetical protein
MMNHIKQISALQHIIIDECLLISFHRRHHHYFGYLL